MTSMSSHGAVAQINAVIAGQAIAGVAAGSAGIINAVASEVMPGVYRTWAQSALNCSAAISAVISLVGMGTSVQESCSTVARD